MTKTEIKVGLIIVGLLLFSCSREKRTPVRDVVVHGIKNDVWELELKVNRKGQGWSIHNFSWDRYDFDEPYWMYVDRINGRVPGKRVATTVLRGSYSFHQYSDGYIDFDSLIMTVNLKTGNTPHELNGIYRLKLQSLE